MLLFRNWNNRLPLCWWWWTCLYLLFHVGKSPVFERICPIFCLIFANLACLEKTSHSWCRWQILLKETSASHSGKVFSTVASMKLKSNCLFNLKIVCIIRKKITTCPKIRQVPSIIHPQFRANFFVIILYNSVLTSFGYSFCFQYPWLSGSICQQHLSSWGHTLYPFHLWEIEKIIFLLKEPSLSLVWMVQLGHMQYLDQEQSSGECYVSFGLRLHPSHKYSVGVNVYKWMSFILSFT